MLSIRQHLSLLHRFSWAIPGDERIDASLKQKKQLSLWRVRNSGTHPNTDHYLQVIPPYLWILVGGRLPASHNLLP
jgi:hypothetical protein